MTLKSAIHFAALATMLGTGFSYAHSGATGVVKQRMDMMKSIGEATKTVGAMIKGDAPFNSGEVASAAERIANHAQAIPEMFPEGTTDAPSEALPAIWTNWDEFQASAKRLEKRALALRDAATEASDVADIRPAFAAIAKNCKSCHESFRLKK